jgi:hypothetical protein
MRSGARGIRVGVMGCFVAKCIGEWSASEQ